VPFTDAIDPSGFSSGGFLLFPSSPNSVIVVVVNDDFVIAGNQRWKRRSLFATAVASGDKNGND
jgi:hypothetical protein